MAARYADLAAELWQENDFLTSGFRLRLHEILIDMAFIGREPGV